MAGENPIVLVIGQVKMRVWLPIHMQDMIGTLSGTLENDTLTHLERFAYLHSGGTAHAVPVVDEIDVIAISPFRSGAIGYPDRLPSPGHEYCEMLSRAWSDLLSVRSGTDLQVSDTAGNGMSRLWRGMDEISQLHSVFRCKGAGDTAYLCLLPEAQVLSQCKKLLAATIFINARWHAARGGIVLHASGVRRGEQGFVFLGQSGAGKSTAAQLSMSAGALVVNEELIYVRRDPSGSYSQVMSTPGAPSSRGLPPNCFDAPITGLFTLVQDTEDFLVPISQRDAAIALHEDMLDLGLIRECPAGVSKMMFRNACAIAKSVPAFELHFRKSPQFWEVIDAEFRR